MPDDDQKPQSNQLEIALARIVELERERTNDGVRVAVVERENQELRAKLMAMEKQLRRLLRRVIAPRTETLIHDPGQQPIAEIAAAVAHLQADAAVAGVPAVVVAAAAGEKSTRPAAKPRGRGRLTLPEHLETVEDRITLSSSELVDHDGTLLVPVGTERAERLDWEPGRFLRRVTLRTRYGRKDTREPVLTAPVPPAIVARGLGTDRLVLHIAHQKYGL